MFLGLSFPRMLLISTLQKSFLFLKKQRGTSDGSSTTRETNLTAFCYQHLDLLVFCFYSSLPTIQLTKRSSAWANSTLPDRNARNDAISISSNTQTPAERGGGHCHAAGRSTGAPAGSRSRPHLTARLHLRLDTNFNFSLRQRHEQPISA